MSSGRSRSRRNANGEDVQPVVQVAAKLAILDRFLEIAVGGAATHVQPAWCECRTAQSRSASTQQLGLNLKRNVANLVEKIACRGPPSRRPIFCEMARGERAPLVTKAAPLSSSPVGDRGAIDLHNVRSLRAAIGWRAQSILAGARLAQQQHRRVAGSYRLLTRFRT